MKKNWLCFFLVFIVSVGYIIPVHSQELSKQISLEELVREYQAIGDTDWTWCILRILKDEERFSESENPQVDGYEYLHDKITIQDGLQTMINIWSSSISFIEKEEIFSRSIELGLLQETDEFYQNISVLMTPKEAYILADRFLKLPVDRQFWDKNKQFPEGYTYYDLIMRETGMKTQKEVLDWATERIDNVRRKECIIAITKAIGVTKEMTNFDTGMPDSIYDWGVMTEEEMKYLQLARNAFEDGVMITDERTGEPKLCSLSSRRTMIKEALSFLLRCLKDEAVSEEQLKAKALDCGLLLETDEMMKKELDASITKEEFTTLLTRFVDLPAGLYYDNISYLNGDRKLLHGDGKFTYRELWNNTPASLPFRIDCSDALLFDEVPLVSVRGLLEAMGATVEWREDRTILMTYNKEQFLGELDDSFMYFLHRGKITFRRPQSKAYLFMNENGGEGNYVMRNDRIYLYEDAAYRLAQSLGAKLTIDWDQKQAVVTNEEND